MIDNNKMLKLTQGQGHDVKGQGEICNFVKQTLVLTMYQEPMIGYWLCLYTWQVLIGC